MSIRKPSILINKTQPEPVSQNAPLNDQTPVNTYKRKTSSSGVVTSSAFYVLKDVPFIPQRIEEGDPYFALRTSLLLSKINLPTTILPPFVFANCPLCQNSLTNPFPHQPAVKVLIPAGQYLCQKCSFKGTLAGPFQPKVVAIKPSFSAIKNSKSANTVLNKLDPLIAMNSGFEWPCVPPQAISNKNAQSWLASRQIPEELLQNYGVYIGEHFFPQIQPQGAIAPCVVFPYKYKGEVVNFGYLNHKEDKQFEISFKPTFFGLDDIEGQKEAFITIDEFDKLSLATIGINNAVSIPFLPNHEENSFSEQFSFLLHAEKTFASIERFILAIPPTSQGLAIEEELARRLGKERCFRLHWGEEYTSINAALMSLPPDSFRKFCSTYRPFPVKGIFEVDDVLPRLHALYQMGLPRGKSTGWTEFDDFYTVKEGQWTLVTGIPGHGKSNFLDAMLVNIARTNNWSFGMFSPENQPIERHFANLIEKYSGKAFSNDYPHSRLTPEELDLSAQWLQNHFFVILPDEDDNWSVDGILNLAKILVYRKGIKGLVIDPWNELDHSRSNGVTETEHISQALTKIRQFARIHAVHVWVVAHPAKLYKQDDGRYPVPTPYDVSGSSHWNNKADNAISVWRNRGFADQTISDVHVQKIRFKEVGKVGMYSFRFDPMNSRYIDDVDQIKRQESINKGYIYGPQDMLVSPRSLQPVISVTKSVQIIQPFNPNTKVIDESTDFSESFKPPTETIFKHTEVRDEDEDDIDEAF